LYRNQRPQAWWPGRVLEPQNGAGLISGQQLAIAATYDAAAPMCLHDIGSSSLTKSEPRGVPLTPLKGLRD
jgi:hypothetical protein